MPRDLAGCDFNHIPHIAAHEGKFERGGGYNSDKAVSYNLVDLCFVLFGDKRLLQVGFCISLPKDKNSVSLLR